MSRLDVGCLLFGASSRVLVVNDHEAKKRECDSSDRCGEYAERTIYIIILSRKAKTHVQSRSHLFITRQRKRYRRDLRPCGFDLERRYQNLEKVVVWIGVTLDIFARDVVQRRNSKVDIIIQIVVDQRACVVLFENKKNFWWNGS